MNKRVRILSVVVVVLAITSLIVATAGGALAQGPKREIPKGLKIGYFVSTLNNGFHQAHS